MLLTCITRKEETYLHPVPISAPWGCFALKDRDCLAPFTDMMPKLGKPSACGNENKCQSFGFFFVSLPVESFVMDPGFLCRWTLGLIWAQGSRIS